MGAVSSLSRKLLKAPLHALVNAVPLGVSKRMFPKDVITLCYHVVSNEDLPHIKLRLMASPQLIESEIVTYCDIIRQVMGQKKVPFAFPIPAIAGRRLFSRSAASLRICRTVLRPSGLHRNPQFIVNRLLAITKEAGVVHQRIHYIYYRRNQDDRSIMTRKNNLREIRGWIESK